jgi:hypothetical protein
MQCRHGRPHRDRPAIGLEELGNRRGGIKVNENFASAATSLPRPHAANAISGIRAP